MEKTVVITGASSGIGAACAMEFANSGYKVAVCYNNNEEKAVQLCNAINEKNGKNIANPFKVDVSNEQSVKTMFKNVLQAFGDVHVLINNAGIARQELFTQIAQRDWDEMFAVNVRGTFLCSKEVLPQMINRKSGTIINVSSMWGQVGASCEVSYSAAKAAIIGMTKALAKEEGPSGITVNCIAPGVIETPMLNCFSAEDKAELANETPLCRLGTGQDVAKTALFLASENALFITGQVIGVNGGFVI